MIYSNSHICLISCDMTRKSVMKLPSIIDALLSGNVDKNLISSIRFFHYVGKDRGLWRTMNENMHSREPFQYNNSSRTYFIEETINDVQNLKESLFLFELHSFYFSSNTDGVDNDDMIVDAINLEYLCLLYHYLNSIGLNFYFAISGIISEDRRYTDITEDDYHRTRIFLFLESLYGINDRLRALCAFEDKGNYVEKWASLYSESNILRIKNINDSSKEILNNRMFGKILPLIHIDHSTYIYLQALAFKPESYEYNNLVEQRLDELLAYYIERISQLLDCETNQFIKQTHETDNLFEAIFFSSILYYLLISSETHSFSLNEIITFHEKCIDCAQGCFQLFENSFYHVVNADGWANTALRIREKTIVLDNKETKKQYDFEFNISDLTCNTSAVGIVSKFIENHPNDNFDDIKLEYFFGEDGGEKLKDFFSKEKNIANHYGLMILNNVVASNRGTIRVRSGGEIYSNIKGEDLDGYMPWDKGTVYTISFPIVFKTEEPKYYDSIAFENMELPDVALSTVNFTPHKFRDRHFTDYHSKEIAIEDLKRALDERIRKSIREKVDNPILVVDCSGMIVDIYYEILAKSFFLELCDTISNNQLKIKNLAFINLQSRHHTIKLFRQFALFYDRRGKNQFLDNANIFIVDKDASLPLHFMGDINDIFAEKNYLEVYGGVDSTAIDILNALGRNFDGSK